MSFFALDLQHQIYLVEYFATLTIYMFLDFLNQYFTFHTFVFHQLIYLNSKRMFESAFHFDFLMPTIHILYIVHHFPLVFLATLRYLLM